jgi:hypothetical protein
MIAVFVDKSQTCEDGLDLFFGAKPEWIRVCILSFRSTVRLRCQIQQISKSTRRCGSCDGLGYRLDCGRVDETGNYQPYCQKTPGVEWFAEVHGWATKNECEACDGNGQVDIEGIFGSTEIDLDAPDATDRLFKAIQNCHRFPDFAKCSPSI